MKKIHVLIVDDSPLVQSVLLRILSAESDIEVVGTASDPFEAREFILKQAPDVITLDVEMPRMDGIAFLKHLMSYRPIPVIMISSYTRANSRKTMEALEEGAVDFVAKPTENLETNLEAIRHEIVFKVHAAAIARIRPFFHPPRPGLTKMPANGHFFRKILAVGASTGGVQAIQKFLGAIEFRTQGLVVVQHMAAGYTESFAERLDRLLPMFKVQEAWDMAPIKPDTVYIAPGGKHVRVVRDRGSSFSLRLDTSEPFHFQRPAVDVLFHSMARNVGRNAVGILLTGMGEDGADGLVAMHTAGALTAAQDQTSSIVFGMPKEAIKRGGVDLVGSPEQIPGLILERLKQNVSNAHDRLVNGKNTGG